MSEYKMNQYDLQSYFKSLCNSFYIAYEQVKRLEKEKKALVNDYNEEDLEMVKSLLEISVADSTQNKYITYKYSREELEKEKERLEAEEKEYERKIEKLETVLSEWAGNMRKVSKEIAETIYQIKNNKFSIIVTTKAEVYALIRFYSTWNYSVKEYPIVNMAEEYRPVFPTGEEVYEGFLYAYEEDMKCDSNVFMSRIFDKYF